MLILASYHTHCSGGGGGGGAGCEEASAFDFPLPPFGVRSSRKAWNLDVPRLAASPCLQLLLISWAVMACFLEGGWADAAHWAPRDFPSRSPGNFGLL